MKASPDLPVVLDARVVVGTGGGPDKTILNQPRFLEGAYRNPCAYLRSPSDAEFVRIRERARQCGAPLIEIDDRGACDIRVVLELLRVCRREKVAIWHGHDYKTNLLGLVLSRFWPMRLVTTVHGWGVQDTRRTKLYYAIDRLCLPRYEAVFCVSQSLADACRDAGVCGSRRILLENGIDVEQFRRSRGQAEARRDLGLPPDRLTVGAVGRLSDEKGFDLLIRAVDRLVTEGLDLQLVIVGEGGERPKLEALIAALGRGDRVSLLGYRPDVRGIYEAFDVYALSSLREGLPNVLLEAMALEVPVVATRIAGVPSVIRPGGENGLLIEPGSEDELAGALGRALRDEGLRRSLAQAGRETIETRYSFAARMDRVRATYDALLSRNPTQRRKPL